MTTCLIVADDPTARTKLRRIVNGLGIEVLEAASVAQAHKCLDPYPDVVMAVENAPDGENLFAIFDHLPGRRSPGAPRRVAYEIQNSRGGITNAHVVARLQDAEVDTVDSTLKSLGVI
jgi:CheY-like chemotaxis protein